ncbi:MAG: hypothetical protein QM492_07205 [Rhodobacterales bacterium]
MQLAHGAYLALATATGLAACSKPAPMTVDRAMAECTLRAHSAVKPDVSVGLGVGTGGYGTRVTGGIGIAVSGDYLRGSDPYKVYEDCVVAKSGVKPTQPLKL